MGDYNTAINNYTKCIAILQKDNENQYGYYLKYAFFNRGLARIKTQRKNEGCLDLSKAGELGQEKAYQAITEYCND